jgi:hypothetical protein
MVDAAAFIGIRRKVGLIFQNECADRHMLK